MTPEIKSGCADGTSVISVDVGGTNTRLSLIAFQSGTLESLFTIRIRNTEIADLGEGLARGFARATERGISPSAVAISAAGPVRENSCVLTNISWEIRGSALSERFGVPVVVMNDFTAQYFSLPVLGQMGGDVLLHLHGPTVSPGAVPGDAPRSIPPGAVPGDRSMRAVIGAGTGLGVGFLMERNGKLYAIASEGGHVGFAPFDTETEELRSFVREKYGGNTEIELILSGRGIENIYEYLVASGRIPRSEVTERIDSPETVDRPMAIADEAQRDARFAEVMELFVRIYAKFARDVALTSLCTGGLFIGGGIGAKNCRFFTDDYRFSTSFTDHPNGAFREILESIPVFLIRDPDAALFGAANAYLHL